MASFRSCLPGRLVICVASWSVSRQSQPTPTGCSYFSRWPCAGTIHFWCWSTRLISWFSPVCAVDFRVVWQLLLVNHTFRIRQLHGVGSLTASRVPFGFVWKRVHVVQQLNNFYELAEDEDHVFAIAWRKLPQFDAKILQKILADYGSVATKKLVNSWLSPSNKGNV